MKNIILVQVKYKTVILRVSSKIQKIISFPEKPLTKLCLASSVETTSTNISPKTPEL